MKTNTEPAYIAGGVLLRTPLLPLDAAYKPAYVPDPEFEAGLYLSSKAFFQEYEKRSTLSGCARDKLERSLAKYRLRASTRCTPFATYAGLSLGALTDTATKVILGAPDAHKVRLRPDMEVVARFVQRLLSRRDLLQQLRFCVNNSLYPVAGGYRYAEYQLHRGVRRYELIQVAATPYLSAVLDAARAPVRYTELAVLLQGATAAGDEAIGEYLQRLIDSQLLVSELEPTVTGGDVLEQLIAVLAPLRGTGNDVRALRELQQQLDTAVVTTELLRRADAAVAALIGNDAVPDTTLQADLFVQPITADMNRADMEALLAQVQAVFTMARPAKNRDLDIFRSRFTQLYDGQLVPLTTALDADLGIGYAAGREELAAMTGLIDGLPLGAADPGAVVELSPGAVLALRKYEQWRREGTGAVVITDEDLQPFAGAAAALQMPDSMYLTGSLLRGAGDALIFDLSGMGGPSAANLLGRFTYGDDTLRDLARELLAAEEAFRPDAIFAEIAHLPQARTGNILRRPLLRGFEIPYIGLSGAPPGQQIPIDDIEVGVAAGTIQLWSRRHRKQVFPRLTTAHNYSHQSLPVYKFLCDLQTQGLALPVLWDWAALEVMKHLPRVSYRNLILRKARWMVEPGDPGPLPAETANRDAAIRSWQSRAGIPDRVVYADGDNELLIDFREPMGCELFLHYLNRHKQLRLEEFLFTTENAVVRNRSGEAFTNEIILPLTRRLVPAPLHQPPVPAGAGGVPRSFIPGSEWMYYKLYCGPQTMEDLLRNVIRPLVERALRNGWCRQFFFVCYNDDACHLRLRFHAPEKDGRQQLSDALYVMLEDLRRQGLLRNVVCDTYRRELERYGAHCIGMAEQLFHNDSLAVLAFMGWLEDRPDATYRLLLALRATDALLHDFGLSLEQKGELAGVLQHDFFEAFGGQPQLRKALNKEYRQYQKDIFLCMDSRNDALSKIEEAVTVITGRSQMNAPVIAALKGACSDSQWTAQLPSYIHMFLNRLFIAQQRKYELVVYHFLEKYYASRRAIAARRHSVTEPPQPKDGISAFQAI